MAFEIGQKVVCINDQFPAILYEFAFMIPRKGHVYTVRERRMCMHVITQNVEDGLRFFELPNPASENNKEPFFSAWRFRPWEDELSDEEKEEMKLVSVVGR